MELLIKADMLEFVEFTENVSDVRFDRELKLITDNKVAPFISYELVVAMKALTRGNNEQTEIYQFWFNFVRPYCVFAVYERFVVTQANSDREHEAPFCSDFADDYVLCYSPPGGLVGDPFVGSGTVAFAVHRAGDGRRFTGGDLGVRKMHNGRWQEHDN